MTSQANKFYGYVTTKDHALSFCWRRKPVMLRKKECQIVLFIIAFTICDKDVGDFKSLFVAHQTANFLRVERNETRFDKSDITNKTGRFKFEKAENNSIYVCEICFKADEKEARKVYSPERGISLLNLFVNTDFFFF